MLKGSPFAIGVSPGNADAAKCTAVVEAAGRNQRRLEAGQELAVAIQLRDSFGNVTNNAGAYETSHVAAHPLYPITAAPEPSCGGSTLMCGYVWVQGMRM